jgi:hypothetical protein
VTERVPINSQTFNTFWTGGDICPVTVMCMNSFVSHGGKLNLYSYDELPSAPKTVEICDAASIIPRSEVFEAHGGFEHFSDLFRYELLHRVGGWWIDTDVVCNTATLPPSDIAFARESRTGSFASGQMRFPKGHEVLRLATEQAASLQTGDWGATGPRLLTSLIKQTGNEDRQWPTADFYPICWAESAKYLLPEFCDEMLERTRDALFIHIYTSRFRRRLSFDQRRFLPPSGSFLEKLYLRFGVGAAAENLVPIDEHLLRRSISTFMREDWIQQILSQEGLSFAMNAVA